MLCQQALLQEIPGSKKMGLDRANGQGEDVCHIFICPLLKVAQNQDHAIPGRQQREMLTDKGLRFPPLSALFYLLLQTLPREHLFCLHSRVPCPFPPFQLSQTTMIRHTREPVRKTRLAAECR